MNFNSELNRRITGLIGSLHILVQKKDFNATMNILYELFIEMKNENATKYDIEISLIDFLDSISIMKDKYIKKYRNIFCKFITDIVSSFDLNDIDSKLYNYLIKNQKMVKDSFGNIYYKYIMDLLKTENSISNKLQYLSLKNTQRELECYKDEEDLIIDPLYRLSI